MKKYKIISLGIALLMLTGLFAQIAPKNREMVSLNADLKLNEAVVILENVIIRETGKKLINMSSFNNAIGIQINSVTWDAALELILLKNRLILHDSAGYLAIQDVSIPDIVLDKAVDPQVVIGTAKQVRISAVAMLADRAYLKSLGVDWSTVFNGKVTINAGYSGASQISSLMNLTGSGTATIGKYSMDINTLIKTIESNQKGQILAQPSILVSSGKQGFIQVGQDISIKTADEAGNTKDTFFATGVIMDVTPTIVADSGVELVHLALSIERSSGVPSDVSTVITKSKSSTDVVLFNNEETVIAGLFDTDQTKTRSGIPVLKDLPWWFFGIRYLTGYDSYEKKERELIITLKVEIMDSALERMKKATIEVPKPPDDLK